MKKENINMKLFYTPGACSLSVHIALCETGANFSLEKVDLRTKNTEHNLDFFSISPNGYVPALQLGNGQVLTEVTALLQYIARLHPDAGLAPATGSKEHDKLLEWLGFIASELHRNLGSLFNPAMGEEFKASVLSLLARRLDWLAVQLEGKTYLLGEQFSIADGYLYTILNWSNFVSYDLGPWKVVQDYMARVASRPGVQVALKQEGLLPA